jgi:hypothetical protein
MAGCFGIGRTPRRVAEVYHITPKLVGFSDFPYEYPFQLSSQQTTFGTITVL